MKPIVVAITGASGSIYGLRLVEELLASGRRVTLLLSANGLAVLRHETGLDWADDFALRQAQVQRHFGSELLEHVAVNDLFASIASGSAAPAALVVVPCSMGSAARIAAGTSDSLIERVADVVLKERRQLIVVPRETPLNRIHLRNLLTLNEAGAEILPAMPGFYHRPQTLEQLVDQLVAKILDRLGVEHQLVPRWGDKNS